MKPELKVAGKVLLISAAAALLMEFVISGPLEAEVIRTEFMRYIVLLINSVIGIISNIAVWSMLSEICPKEKNNPHMQLIYFISSVGTALNISAISIAVCLLLELIPMVRINSAIRMELLLTVNAILMFLWGMAECAIFQIKNRMEKQNERN